MASYSDYGFYKDGIYWKTLEHYYQAQKFNDDNIRQQIINATTPKKASIIGRDRNNPLVENRDKIKQFVMLEGLYQKFISNEDIKQKLLSTGNKIIIEATTKEYYWGCGVEGTGENNFGKLLMKVRERIRNEISDNNFD